MLGIIKKIECERQKAVIKAINKAEKERKEVLDKYRNTGCEKHYEKVEELEAEIAELMDYLVHDYTKQYIRSSKQNRGKNV